MQKDYYNQPADDIEPYRDLQGHIQYSIRVIGMMRDANYPWTKIGELHNVSWTAVRSWYLKYKDIPTRCLNLNGDFFHLVGKRGRLPNDQDPNLVVGIIAPDDLPTLEEMRIAILDFGSTLDVDKYTNAYTLIISIINKVYNHEF